MMVASMSMYYPAATIEQLCGVPTMAIMAVLTVLSTVTNLLVRLWCQSH